MRLIRLMNADHNSARFQIQLRDIFIATFWAALWCGSWIATFESVGRIVPVWIIVGLYRFFGPFVAIGALFRRTWLGVIIGFIVFAAVAVAEWIAISNGWIDFP